MSAAAWVQSRKEIRALLPWCVTVAGATVLGGALVQRADLPGARPDHALWIALIHVAGVLSVAAWTVGQELAHGTLSTLLVQPAGRLRLLGTKLLVLGAALLALGATAGAMIPEWRGPVASRPLLIWGPVALGLGLVPLLTLLSRRTLGGVVFAPVLPGLILVVADRFYPLRDGLQAWPIVWYGTLVASALGIAAFALVFHRLQVAGDGEGRPAASARGAADRRGLSGARVVFGHWTWLSVKKELRLQQMTFAVSGLYVAGAVLVSILQRSNPLYVGPTFAALSALHGLFIPLLAGCLASAEERQMGTLATGLLQPRAAWTQWAIKVGVAAALALTLGLGLPALLAWLPPIDRFQASAEFGVAAVLVLGAGVYVSSLSSNTLWALIVSFPVMGIAVEVAGVSVGPIVRILNQAMPIVPGPPTAGGLRVASIRAIEDGVAIALALGFVMLLSVFAGRNHRSLDRSVRVVANQVAGLILYAIGAATVSFAVSRLLWGLR